MQKYCNLCNIYSEFGAKHQQAKNISAIAECHS